MAVLDRAPRISCLLGFAVALLIGQPLVFHTGCGEVAPIPSGSASPRTVTATNLAGKRLAVLELKGTSIKNDALDAFADAIRGGSVERLAGSGLQVMTRENMLVLIREMGKKECSEGDCEVETGRNIGADFVVSGSVVTIDNAFVVTLKLHETKGGTLLASDQVDAQRQLDVLHLLREHGKALVATIAGPGPAASSAAPVTQRPAKPVQAARYAVRAYNVDDRARIYVNDHKVVEVKVHGDSGFVDITQDLEKGDNTIVFLLDDFGGDWTYGFTLQRDRRVIWEDECGEIGWHSCARDRANVHGEVGGDEVHAYYKTYKITVP